MIGSWMLTAPVAQPNMTKFAIGDPVEVSLSAGTAALPYQGQTAAGAPVAGQVGSLVVALTAADMQTIMGVIIARAVANGQGIPAGSINVA
jgi:hypothetical protein